MTKMLLTTTVLAGFVLAGVGWAGAQTPTTGHEGHDHAAAAKAVAIKGAPTTAPTGGTAKSAGGMGMGMMGGSGMCSMMGGAGMGGTGSMGGMGTMMNLGGPGTQVAVKNTDKGVTITLTATDPAKVVRLQKMAEAMRLMHEATAQ